MEGFGMKGRYRYKPVPVNRFSHRWPYYSTQGACKLPLPGRKMTFPRFWGFQREWKSGLIAEFEWFDIMVVPSFCLSAPPSIVTLVSAAKQPKKHDPSSKEFFKTMISTTFRLPSTTPLEPLGFHPPLAPPPLPSWHLAWHSNFFLSCSPGRQKLTHHAGGGSWEIPVMTLPPPLRPPSSLCFSKPERDGNHIVTEKQAEDSSERYV